MAYKLIKTHAFQNDLDAVVGYLVLSLQNKPAAVSLLDRVEKCYQDLERMPLMYESCCHPHLKELGYRKVCIHHYILVYKVDEVGKTVTLMRLFHGRQDYEKLI